MPSLKRTLLVRYAAAMALVVLIVVLIIVFGVHAGTSETIVFLVGVGVLAGLLGGITYWTQRTLAADLKEIGVAIEKILVENDLDRMPQPRLAELNSLAQDLDAVADKVRENYRLLTQERDRFEAVLDNINAGIIVVGRDLKTRMINPVAEKLLGTTREYAIGRTFTEIHHTPTIDRAIERARRGEEVELEVTITLPRRRALKVQASPITTRTGKVGGVVCILEDVTSKRRLQRVRSDFVANVSHELRTPVANMRAVVDALVAGAAQDPEAAERFTRDLDKESRRLADIIEDLLVLSRLESDRRETAEELFDVRQVLEEIAGEKAGLAASSEVALTVDGKGPEAVIRGDRKLVKTACSNLIDNAIKYNRPGGRVEMSIESTADEITVVVADTGIGIPAPEQRKIFERFYRVDKARSRETGGTGLGLSIVKHAAEFHGGTVLLESRPGEGSTFRLVLPSVPSLF
jgi:two-component system phosphate regulon sensor histidine kinase PhoR